MSREMLAILALVQALIVAVLFGLLIWHRIVRTLQDQYRSRKATGVTAALREWVAGSGDGAAVATAFRRCPIPAGRQGIEEAWKEMGSEERERVSELLRRSLWTRRARRSCRSRFWWKRMEASQILAFLDDPADVPVLRERLRDRAPAVRVGAIFAARALTPPQLLDDLLQLVVKAEPARRKVLLDALAAYGAVVVPALARHLEDPRLGTSERASLLSLAEHLANSVREPELTECVLPYTRDLQLEVRVKAVRALATLPGERADARLLRALRDPAWEVRAQAAKALGRRGTPRAARALRQALGDRTWWVRLRAGIALRQLGRAGRAELQGAQREADPFARDMADYALRLEDAAVLEYGS
ncbi:MAG: HEAT repeat domain-containing protein [Gemmatimonadota bacterium]